MNGFFLQSRIGSLHVVTINGYERLKAEAERCGGKREDKDDMVERIVSFLGTLCKVGYGRLLTCYCCVGLAR